MTKTYTDAPCPILNQKGRNVGYIWNFYGRIDCPTKVDFGTDTDELAYFRVISAATSGDLEGVRARVESEAETGTTMNINAFHGDAVVNADGYAAIARGIYTDAMVKDDATVTSVRGGDFNISIYDGASITNCEGLRVVVGHPTAAVSISGVDTILNLVLDGSNNHAMASAINLSCSSGTSVTIGIDFGDSNAVTAIDIGDVTYGIVFTGTATKGIDFGDETTTAIDIGTCTTGISMTGTMTTSIDFTSATISPDADRTNSVIAIGDRLGEKTITLPASASQNLDPIQINLNIAGSNPSSTSTINSIYQNITHDTTAMANLRLKCADWSIVVAKNVQDVYVYQGEIDFSGTTTASGEVAVMGLVLNSGTATSCNSWRVLNCTLRGTAAPADAHGIMINAEEGLTVADGIRLMGTGMQQAIRIGDGSYGQSPVNFVGFPEAGTAPVSTFNGTAHGGTIVKIACKVGSATYYMLASTAPA